MAISAPTATARVLYSTDASIYQVAPFAVVLPRHVEQVHAAVELAAKHHVPVLPRAAGSSFGWADRQRSGL